MILVVAEHAGGQLGKITAEMVSAAASIDATLPVAILILGSNVAPVANEAARLSPQILVADRSDLAAFDPEVWTAAVTQVAQEGEARYVLIAASRSGREYSPRLAIKLNAALLEDAIGLKTEGDTTVAEHYTYLARVKETIETQQPVVVATVKPGAFAVSGNLAEPGEQFDVELNLHKPRVRITERTNERAARVSLEEADVVVSGGRGVGSAEGFSRYIEPLADRLSAGIGTTRAVVDAGWRPYSEQIGQTGKTVQPKAYIAIGISGAVQHLSGMSKSKFIVAINKDAESPIFKVADLGIVGNISEIVPEILATLQK